MGCGVLVGFEDAVMFLPVKMIVVMFFEILVVVLLCFFLQMLWIIRMGQPLAKRTISSDIFLQMLWIILMDQPLAKRIIENDIFCKYTGLSGFAGLLQIG